VTLRIAPSLASAPLDRLGLTVAELEAAGADALHFDIEDGTFVPVMTLGTRIISALRPLTGLAFDVHLMMVNPEWIIPHLAKIGIERLSVHYEACPYPRRVLGQIAALGISAGLAFNPATPLPDLSYLRPYLSFLLILTSEPELSGSPFLPDVLEKVREGRKRLGLERIEWVVDGGINADNISQVGAAGADAVVVGRAAFRDGRITENLQALRRAAK